MRRASASLVLFRAVLNDSIGTAMLALVETLSQMTPDEDLVRERRGHLFALLADEAEMDGAALPGDAWQAHLMRRILEDENAFSRKAQCAARDGIGPALLEQARRDLRALQALYQPAATELTNWAARACGESTPFPSWEGLRPLAYADSPRIVEQLRGCLDWGPQAEALAAHYQRAGAGIFAQFVAFRWTHHGGAPRLEGVAHPDPVRLADLVGYEQEREPAVLNAERFAQGLPANNVLLYGDRGTGKSSTVKALLNELSHQGLRLIEIPKELLADFPHIVSQLRERRERFLLFVDDLSFEEHETGYKGLKALLEGSLEARPENVVLYATSNRRHLVRQRFADRDSAPDDPHHGDTVEEKLSLSDRFGLRVRFLTPDQGRYLAITRALASKRELRIPDDQLAAQALRWAARHGGRSPRTARQFVDHLAGELAHP